MYTGTAVLSIRPKHSVLMTSSLFPDLKPCQSRLTPLIMSYNEMLPGILGTPENKQQLLEEMKRKAGVGCFGNDAIFARKDLSGGRYVIVWVACNKSKKRPRGGTPKTTYSFVVLTEVRKTKVPTAAWMSRYDRVGTPYRKDVGDDADALWTAVCEALKVQRAAPGNLCVHCIGRSVLGRTDTCWDCALGLQYSHKAEGDTPTRVEDRKTPKPRP